MRVKELKGKTIKKVHQSRFDGSATGEVRWRLVAIEFTDGSVMRFNVMNRHDFSFYGVAGEFPARRIGE